MKFITKLKNNLLLVPAPLWIVNSILFLIPFLVDTPPDGYQEFIWFLYIIPAYIFSYYWGVWGGIVPSVLTISAQMIYEFTEYVFEVGDYKEENFIMVFVTSLITILIAIGIGLFAEKLKKVNIILQNNNRQLEYLSNMDDLTDLSNRRGFIKEADNWLKNCNHEDQNFSILFIDLDKFKPVNDLHGHQVGDKLLQEVANRLKRFINKGTIISRIGGDEFAVLLKNADEFYSVQLAHQIKNDLSIKYIIDSKEIYITASIGISLASDHESDIESLLQNADIAMYSVKRKGRNDFLIFDPTMKEFTEKQVNLQNQIRKAIDQEELILYYQPQYDVKTEQIVQFEALIRWSRNNEIILPMDFIPIAEESGLIIPIGKWVLETACKQLKTWAQEGYPALPISVNVSAYQFRQSDFIQSVKKVLTDTQINPHLLTLELTETVILENESTVIEKLIELKQLGISLSIDDFGSGYSSLSYLKDFPVDEIKIDRSFINDLHCNSRDRSLVNIIIKIGESLGAKIVAEGVETLEQFNFLKDAGCNLIQGYLIGRPMSALDIVKNYQEDFNLELCESV